MDINKNTRIQKTTSIWEQEHRVNTSTCSESTRTNNKIKPAEQQLPQPQPQPQPQPEDVLRVASTAKASAHER